MKTNKKLINISIIFTILTFLWLVISYSSMGYKIFEKVSEFFYNTSNVQQALSTSFFSAMLVLLLTTLITYRYQKKYVFKQYALKVIHTYRAYKDFINRINIKSDIDWRINLLDNLYNKIIDCTLYSEMEFCTYKLENFSTINNYIYKTNLILLSIQTETNKFRDKYIRYYCDIGKKEYSSQKTELDNKIREESIYYLTFLREKFPEFEKNTDVLMNLLGEKQ